MEARKVMRSWILIVPALLLAGCSKTNSFSPDAQAAGDPAQVATQADARGDAGRDAKSEPERDGVVIPRGTALQVRIDESLDTKRNRAGDQFRASLAEPIVMEGK